MKIWNSVYQYALLLIIQKCGNFYFHQRVKATIDACVYVSNYVHAVCDASQPCGMYTYIYSVGFCVARFDGKGDATCLE